MTLVTYTQDGNVGILTIDNPPVNALSPLVADEIRDSLKTAEADPAIDAIVVTAKGKTFVSGADIHEFAKLRSGERSFGDGLYPLLKSIEDCPKPVVAAIAGSALGGGLELAIACHYRVAARGAQVGQPEVKLGIIPGAGGTQRLPRLAGVATALELCAKGNSLAANAAVECGIVDQIVDGDLLEAAVAFARERSSRESHPITRALSEKIGEPQSNAELFESARAHAGRRNRGQIAPLRAIEAVSASIRLPFDEGCRKEAELFQECLHSDQSAAMIHAFFASREVRKVPGSSKSTPADVRSVAIVGGGTMGAGIAIVYADAGIAVILKEVKPELLDSAMTKIRKTYARSVERGRLSQELADQRLALVQPQLSYEGFERVDLVVEAVFEGMEIKKQVFAELDRACKPSAVLASNTSSLDIDEIASATSRPQQVIGHHFFAPPNIMRLLEIVRGKESSKSVIATSMALAAKLGKVGVLVGNCRGFVGNRMYHCYQREAQFLVEEGAKVEQVDAALFGFGMAMGPLATGDLSGLDVSWRIRKEYAHLAKPGVRTQRLADQLCELGRFGQKTKAGWYRYEPPGRKPIPDPAVEEISLACAREGGIGRRSIEQQEIVERTIYALANEGAKILEEGISLRAGDIDIIYLNGYGFPVHRGGPMWYAGVVGLQQVYERICKFREIHGELWEPAPLLERLAEAGMTFDDFDRERKGAE